MKKTLLFFTTIFIIVKICYTYTINATHGGNGVIVPAGSIWVDPGDDITFRYVPDTGYTYTDVMVDGVIVNYAWSTYTFENVQTDHTISVNFSQSLYYGYKTIECLNLWQPGMSVPDSTINPDSIEYLGAFRLPSGGTGYASWNYGGAGLAYYPDGDSTGPNDGFPGSLYGIGHCYEWLISEVSIPVPVISPTHDLNELNTATTLQDFSKVDVGLNSDEIFGLEYMSPQGSQTAAKLYFGQGRMFPINDKPNHGWCNIDLSNPEPAGLWYIGNLPTVESGYSLFEIPDDWANANIGGKKLATGRHRWGQGSGEGPRIFAVAPWQDGNPPPDSTNLNYQTLLRYESSTQAINGYRITDNWHEGAWLTNGNNSAVVICTHLGYGCIWYDHAVFSDYRVSALQFFNPSDLKAVVDNQIQPYEPQPYATLDISSVLYSYDCNNVSQGIKIRGMAYDRQRGLLYIAEYKGDGDKPLIHVWRINWTTSVVEENTEDINISTLTCDIYMGTNFVTFSNLNSGDIVKIYNISGRLVHSSESITDNIHIWDLGNVSSGIYFCKIKGEHNIDAKVVIIR